MAAENAISRGSASRTAAMVAAARELLRLNDRFGEIACFSGQTPLPVGRGASVWRVYFAVRP